MEYFYEGQGNDIALLSDRDTYDWARGMIAYCLGDTEQLIADVHTWVTDWSAVANRVAAQTPISMIHGDENKQFPIGDAADFCHRHEQITLHTAKGAAQLALMTHIDQIIDVLSC